MDLLDLATAYAARGWPIFPVQPGGKRPATRHGCLDATTDAAQVARWWRPGGPPFNIGLRTGIAFDVLDLDGDTGVESWATFTDAHGLPFDLTSQYCVATPSGGFHLYWRPTGHGNRGIMLPKVDWRGCNGYVVAAGSRRPDGTYDEWATGPIPDAPDALIDLVDRTKAPAAGPPVSRDAPPRLETRNRYAGAVLERSCDAIAAAKPGGRHEVLIRMTMRVMAYVKGGELDDATAVEWLEAAAARSDCDPRKVADVITSARIKATARVAPASLAGR